MSDTKPRILIAEDDDENREALTMMLEYSGFACLVAANGAAALQLALDQLPDLMLTDLSLPELNGFELVTRLRAEGFAQPIIVVSAYDDEATQQRAINAGANECLSKPLEFAHLKSRIETLLRQA
jgi:DNA-binding response OmpR family regulator